MIGNRLEKEILGIFDRDIYSFLSINQVSKKLGKAYPYINAKVNELIKEGVLNKSQIGRSYLCSLNLNSEKTIALLSLMGTEKKEKILGKIKNSKEIIEEISTIRKQFKIHTILLYGKSLIFVLDYIHDKEAIKNLFRHIKQFDLSFFDKDGFQNYIMETQGVMQDAVVLYSYEKYFELVNEVKDRMLIQKLRGRK